MIRCDICKKTVFDADKTLVAWVTIKEATNKGFVPTYYLERDKEGIEYGLPKERKWKNIVKTYPKDNMELCKTCYAELTDSRHNKSSKALYCFVATAAYGSPYAEEVERLRNYRDDVLLQKTEGRILISLYYLISPPFAKIISKSPTLKAAVRKHLIAPILKHIDSRY